MPIVKSKSNRLNRNKPIQDKVIERLRMGVSQSKAVAGLVSPATFHRWKKVDKAFADRVERATNTGDIKDTAKIKKQILDNLRGGMLYQDAIDGLASYEKFMKIRKDDPAFNAEVVVAGKVHASEIEDALIRKAKSGDTAAARMVLPVLDYERWGNVLSGGSAAGRPVSGKIEVVMRIPRPGDGAEMKQIDDGKVFEITGNSDSGAKNADDHE